MKCDPVQLEDETKRLNTEGDYKKKRARNPGEGWREKIAAEAAARLPWSEDTHNGSEEMVTVMSEWKDRKYPEKTRTAIGA
jgi:hypothetical protein